MDSDIALFLYICGWSFSCLQKLCAINVAKVSFLNRDHKNGESVCLSPFLWSLFRKKTFSMFIAHNFWRHRNDQLKMYINKAITLDFDKINTYPTIDQIVYISIVEPYWFSPWCCRSWKKPAVQLDREYVCQQTPFTRLPARLSSVPSFRLRETDSMPPTWDNCRSSG